ncbi:MAG: hypothetical protein GF353_28650 [Candidatus Lokiarchaeota archaeon]|nr:hypothetical protein [Candidatus Lokiarchaeota archaeon]MBD3353973.1 hypothetical protein [Candidatus Lokiarchaeota archaeon]
MNIIYFSKFYTKLNDLEFTTIRRYDRYKAGQVYNVFLKQKNNKRFLFAAKLLRKEKKIINKIDTNFLLKDTDCKDRQESIDLINSFYRNEIDSEKEKLTILYFKKLVDKINTLNTSKPAVVFI